jgi:hypothetical protein
MPSLPFQSFEASRGGNLGRTLNRAGKLSPIGDKRQNSHRNSFLFMLSRRAPAIPLATMDLWCDEHARHLTCRRYADRTMIAPNILSSVLGFALASRRAAQEISRKAGAHVGASLRSGENRNLGMDAGNRCDAASPKLAFKLWNRCRI